MTHTHVTLPDTSVYPLRSDAVGDDFELWIAEPRTGFVPPSGPPGVLYLLDANLYFGTAVEMTRLMHTLYGELPQLRVVGIAYPADDGLRQAMLRTRDFTPSEDPGMTAMAASLPRPAAGPPVEPATGGADAFLAFLRDQVVPFVEDRYEVAPGGRAIFGSSLGGLFVAYALQRAPKMFDHFLGVSPALWWNEAEAMEADYPTPDSGPPGVHLAAGALEEAAHVPMLARFRLISNARTLAARLVEEGWPAESTTFEEIAGETHTSVVAPALARGLRAAFPPPPRPPMPDMPEG